MKNNSFKYLLLSTILLAILLLSPAVSANKVKKLELTAPDGFNNAPIIKVYSLDGEKWSEVDKTYISKVSANLRAKCKYQGRGNKAYKGNFYVTGFQTVGDTEPANFLIPHSKTASGNFQYHGDAKTDPVKICNDELKKKVAQQPDLSLEEKYRKYPFLKKGFKVKYPAAIKSTFSLTCNPTGIGFIDYKDRSANINTIIDCQASALAKDKIPKPEIKMAKLILPDMVSKVSYKASPANYVGKCPAGIGFKGHITATRGGEVKYQYIAKDGDKSPVFTMKFDKSGTKATGNWHETVSKPDTTNTLKMPGTGSGGPDVSSWWRLKIISPESKHASTAKYTVTCQDKPSRAILRR